MLDLKAFDCGRLSWLCGKKKTARWAAFCVVYVSG